MKNAIGILGMGLTGQAAYAYYNKKRPVYVYDEKDLGEGYEKLEEDHFQDLEFCIKSPGIHPDHPMVQGLRKAGIPIYSDLEVFQKIVGDKVKIIAITGTNGKTTTSMATAFLLKEKGYRVHLAGNIGKGVLGLVDQVKEGDYVVLECSSFQLKYIEDFKPNIAIITNITSDHLDWHKTLEDYQESKKKICKNQDEKDLVLVNLDDPVASSVEGRARWQTVSMLQIADAYLKKEDLYIFKEKIGSVQDFQLVGNHNVSNLAFAILAAIDCGLTKEEAFQYACNFKAIDHRLQFVAKIDGVDYYNDSKGTNPDSTYVALKSFKDHITLIAGGYDKGSSFYPLLNSFKDRIDHLIVLGQTKDQWIREGKEAGITSIYPVETLKEAVAKAKEVTKTGVVLLSPACASWGMYNNYRERGDEFTGLVQEMKGTRK